MTDDIVCTERLEELEGVIERGLETFVEVGQALLEINEQRFYRDLGFMAFDDYCKERWGWERRHAYRLMDAAKVVRVLDAESQHEVCPMGHTDDSSDQKPYSIDLSPPPLPRTERQARELTPLLKEPEVVREVWQDVVEKHGDKVTAAHVRVAVDERLQRKHDRQEQTQREIEKRDNILSIGISDQAGFERENLALECADAVTQVYTAMKRVDPKRHVPALGEPERTSLKQTLRLIRGMVDEIDAELNRPIHLILCEDDYELG